MLFDSADEAGFVAEVKAEVTQGFAELNATNIYYAKKSVMRISRTLNKAIRYSGNKQTKVELLIHFCETLATARFNFKHSRVLTNLYIRQLKAIDKAIASLHEDLHYDYEEARERLSEYLKSTAR